MKLSKKISAVITGGASGLGAAASEILSSKNVKVTLFDSNEDKGKKQAKKISGFFKNVDVTSPESIRNGLIDARKIFGQERICINCAGIAPAMKTVSRGNAHDSKLFSNVISVNLLGSFFVASQSASGMSSAEEINKDGERGIIINTSSIAAFDGQIGQAAYAASKGGVASLTLPMARDLSSKGIRVVSIAPGVFETPMLKSMPKEIQHNISSQIPFPNRLGKPEEFAFLIQHIIENIMINGEVIRIDGSIRMAPK